MKKVLVTGASGFIGPHTLQLLTNYGFEVHAVCNSNYPKEDKNYNWHQANILELVEIEKIIGEVKPEYLLHLAWETEHGLFWNSQKNNKWVLASMNLVEKFKMNGGKRVVAVGTCAEYKFQSEKCDEVHTPIDPISLYAKCKYEFYKKLKDYCENNDLSYAWGRIFYLYGPGEDPRRLVPFVIESLLQNQLTKTTHGNQIRDYMYVEDVASAFVKLLDSDLKGAINIASGIPIKLNEIVKFIATKTGNEEMLKIGAIPAKEDEPKFIVADVSRLTNELFWQPTFDLSTGLNKTIDWWKSKFLELSATN